MSQKVQQDNLFQLINGVNSDLEELKRNATLLAWQPDGSTIIVDEENGNTVGIPIGGITADHIASVSAEVIIGAISAGQIESINADQISGSITAEQIASVNAASITGSINAGQIASVNASAITGSISAGQITSVNADQIVGGINSTQIISVNATQITGALTAGQIISVNANQVTGTLTATQIGSVFASSISGAITSNQIETVLAGQISGLISSTQIQNVAAGQITGQLSAGQIAASAIDGFTITGAIIRSSAPGSGVPRWQGDTTGIRGYNVLGEVTFAFDNTTGKITTLAGIGGGNKLYDSSFDIVNLPNWNVYIPSAGSGTSLNSNTSLASTTLLTASSSSGTGIIERRADAARSGGFGCRATLLSGTTHIGIMQSLDMSKYARNDVPHTLSVYFRATAGAEVVVFIDEYGGASGYLSTQQTFIATGSYQRASVTRPSFRPDSAGGTVYVWRNNATAGQYIEADDFQLEEGYLVTAYAPKTDEVLPGTLTTVHLNSNAGIVAGQIASVNASTITGTIVATQIDSVNATDIVGNIVATQIESIYAGNITVGGGANGGYLNGAFVAAGTIDAGKLTADAIDGKVITGATVRTAAAGARIALSPLGFKQYASDGTTELVSFPADGSPAMFAGQVTASRGISMKTSTLTVDNDNWNQIGWYDPGDVGSSVSLIGYALPTWLTLNSEEVRKLEISVGSGQRTGRLTMSVGDLGTFNLTALYDDQVNSSRSYSVDILGLFQSDANYTKFHSSFVRKEDTTSRTPYTFSNGWRNYGGGVSPFNANGYYIDGTGTVHLEGLIDKNGGNWVADEVMITLPVGFRPPATRIFHPLADSPNVSVRVDVESTGIVRLKIGGSTNPVGYLVLDGISFKAA
jgi:hypothetical protein